MSQELIATWLGLEPGEWPPSHYRLLGLEPGESDANLIEERVHQRLDTVRRYQMMYPDQATEAMNLIAQAFVCLTDPASKKVYDHDLNGAPPAPVAGATAVVPTAQVAPVAEAADADEPVVVLYNPADDAMPPPVIVPYDETVQPPVALIVTETASPTAPPPAAIPVAMPGPHAPLPPPAPFSPRASRRALYKRMARLRKLIDHWDAAGKYLASPKRRVTRPAEATDLLQQLAGIRALLPELPPLLGQAGQAGYHVLTLAQLNSVPTFQTLAPQQREVLSRDWNDGQLVLEEHRAALRAEIQQLRRQSALQRVGRAGGRFLKGHPGVVLVALAALSLVIVLFRTLVFDWLPKRH